MLHDGIHVALVIEKHAAVASGVVKRGGDERGGGVGFRLSVAQLTERRAGKQGRIAVKHHQHAGAFGLVLRAHHGMASALLLHLPGEDNTRGLEQFFDGIRLMASDDNDALGGGHGARGLDNVFDQRHAARGMQHLGALRPHPGSQAGSKNNNRRVHKFGSCSSLVPERSLAFMYTRSVTFWFQRGAASLARF